MVFPFVYDILFLLNILQKLVEWLRMQLGMHWISQEEDIWICMRVSLLRTRDWCHHSSRQFKKLFNRRLLQPCDFSYPWFCSHCSELWILFLHTLNSSLNWNYISLSESWLFLNFNWTKSSNKAPVAGLFLLFKIIPVDYSVTSRE